LEDLADSGRSDAEWCYCLSLFIGEDV
jgi:hypothetical protein